MQAWLTRMYERLGTRYVYWVVGVASGQAALVAVPLGVALGARYEGLSVAQFAVVLLSVEAALVVAVGGGVFAVRSELKTVFAWVGGGRSRHGAPAVAGALQTGPWRSVAVTLGGCAALVAPVAVVSILTPVHRWKVGDIAFICWSSCTAV